MNKNSSVNNNNVGSGNSSGSGTKVKKDGLTDKQDNK